MEDILKVTDHGIQVLIVGATGMMGSAITHYALQNTNLRVNILSRDPSKNPDLVSRVKQAGGKVITADITKPETLNGVTQGMHTVVSAVIDTNEKVLVDGQKALVEDCLKTGVRRFVPSEYGLDISKFSLEERLASQRHINKVKFEEYLHSSKIPTLRINVGLFAHSLFEILQKTQSYYGDPELKHNITTIEDAAKLVVAAVATAQLTGDVNYSGGDYTIKEIQDIYNKTRGSNIEIRNGGSLSELRNLYENRKKLEGESGESAGFLGTLLVFYDKRSKFDSLDNEAFPDVRATSLREFLISHPKVKLEQPIPETDEGSRVDKSGAMVDEGNLHKMQWDV